jgi:erythromycin esterase
VDSTAEDADLARLAESIGDVKVLGLGEPAHGAREPLEFRNRLFRYLVTRRGFTAVAVESGLHESRLINDFVLGAPGDPREVAASGLTWGFGKFAENIALIEWIRQHNATVGDEKKVRFYGIDLSGGEGGKFTQARTAVDVAIDFLSKAATQEASEMRTRIATYLERFTTDEYATLSSDEQKIFRDELKQLAVLLKRERTKLITATSTETYEWVLQSAVIAQRVENFIRLVPSGSEVTPEQYEAWTIRDTAMASNVRWLLEREGGEGRVLLFAHDAHVMNSELRGGIWSIFTQAPQTLGQHLRHILKTQVFLIGVSSAENSKGIAGQYAPLGTIDSALEQVGLPRFFLNLRGLEPTSPAIPWLSQEQSLRVVYTTQILLQPATAFDGFLFIDQISASE